MLFDPAVVRATPTSEGQMAYQVGQIVGGLLLVGLIVLGIKKGAHILRPPKGPPRVV